MITKAKCPNCGEVLYENDKFICCINKNRGCDFFAIKK